MKIFDAISNESPGAALSAALREFECLHGLCLTLHDCHGVFYHADGRSFFPGRNLHSHPYCLDGRFENASWNRKCHEECKLRIEATADRLRRPFLHSCWKGVTELVVPLERNGTVALLLYAGTFRTPDSQSSEELPPRLREELAQLPSAEGFPAAGLVLELQVFGQGLLYYASMFRERAGTPKETSAAIRRFLEDHAHEKVTLADLAGELHLSRSRTCYLVKYHFGKPFHTLLREERIHRARNLLGSTPLPLKAVAAAVGFRNEFYFNRQFTQVCGVPPGEYRESCRNETGAGGSFT